MVVCVREAWVGLDLDCLPIQFQRVSEAQLLQLTVLTYHCYLRLHHHLTQSTAQFHQIRHSCEQLVSFSFSSSQTRLRPIASDAR
mmetsp:Transcript_30067/g.79422  ORF Transcript_30067/g.79422 Transcript_30067/m.79422 type:complete len:85 (+) Transcript_30067:892-1146(+)